MRLNFPTVVIWTVLTGLVSGQNSFINGNQAPNFLSYGASAQASASVSNFQNFPPGQQASASASVFNSNGAPSLPNQNSQVNGQNDVNAMSLLGALPPPANPVNPFQNFPPSNPGSFPPPPPQQFNGPPNSPGNFPPPPQQFNGPPNSPGNIPPPPQHFNGPPNSPGNFPPPPQQFNGPPNSPGNFFPPQQFNGPPPPFQGPSVNSGSPAMQQPPLAANPFMNPQGTNSFPNTNVNPGNGNGNPPSNVFGRPSANPSPFNNRGAGPNQQRHPFNPPLNRPRNFRPRPNGNNMRNRNPNFRPNPPGPPNTNNFHPKVMPTASPDTDYSLPSDVPIEYPKVDFPKGFFQDMLSGLQSPSDGEPTTGDNITPTVSSDSKTSDSSDYSLPSDVPNEYPNVNFPKGFFQDMLSGLKSTSESEKTTGAVTESSLPQTTTKMTPLSTPKDENNQNQEQQNPRPNRFPNGRPPRFPNGLPRRFPNGLPRRFPNRRRPNKFPHRHRPNQFPNRRRPNQFPNRRPNFPFRRPNSYPRTRPTMISNNSSNSIKGNRTTLAASDTMISDSLFQNTTPLINTITLSTLTSPDTVTYQANTPTTGLSATLITVDNTISNFKELPSSSISKDIQEITTENNDQPSDKQTTNNAEFMQSEETPTATASSFQFITATQKPYEVETSSASNSDAKINPDSFISEMTTVMENFVSKLSSSSIENIKYLTSVAHEESYNEITTPVTKPDDFVSSTEQVSKVTTNEISEAIAIKQVTSEVYKSDEPTKQSKETSKSYIDEVTSTMQPLNTEIKRLIPDATLPPFERKDGIQLSQNSTPLPDIFTDSSYIDKNAGAMTEHSKNSNPKPISSRNDTWLLRQKEAYMNFQKLFGYIFSQQITTNTTSLPFEGKDATNITKKATPDPIMFTVSRNTDSNAVASTDNSNSVKAINEDAKITKSPLTVLYEVLFNWNQFLIDYFGPFRNASEPPKTPVKMKNQDTENGTSSVKRNEALLNLKKFLSLFGPQANWHHRKHRRHKKKNGLANSTMTNIKNDLPNQSINFMRTNSFLKVNNDSTAKSDNSVTVVTDSTTSIFSDDVRKTVGENDFTDMINKPIMNKNSKSKNNTTITDKQITELLFLRKLFNAFLAHRKKTHFNGSYGGRKSWTTTLAHKQRPSDNYSTLHETRKSISDVDMAHSREFHGPQSKGVSEKPTDDSTNVNELPTQNGDQTLDAATTNGLSYSNSASSGTSADKELETTSVTEKSDVATPDRSEDLKTANNAQTHKEVTTESYFQVSDSTKADTTNTKESLVDSTRTRIAASSTDITNPEDLLATTTPTSKTSSNNIATTVRTSSSDTSNTKDSFADTTPADVMGISLSDATDLEDLIATTTPTSKTSSSDTATTSGTSASVTTNTKDSLVDTTPADVIGTSLSDATNPEDLIATTTPTSKTSSSDTATTAGTSSSDTTNTKDSSRDITPTDVLGTSSSDITNPEDLLVATSPTSIARPSSTNIPINDESQNKGITDVAGSSSQQEDSDLSKSVSTAPQSEGITNDGNNSGQSTESSDQSKEFSSSDVSPSGIDKKDKKDEGDDKDTGDVTDDEDEDINEDDSDTPEKQDENDAPFDDGYYETEVPPPGVECRENERYYKCVPNCRQACFNFDNYDVPCPDLCIPGCFCSPGLVVDENGNCVNTTDCKDYTCNDDEDWWECMPKKHNTCKNFARAEAQKDFDCEAGCFCMDGLIKTDDGKCVDPFDCPDPVCDDNEEATDCMNPCNTCEAICHNCNIMLCRAGCDCMDGYKRDSNGTCIHVSNCPVCTTSVPTTENTSPVPILKEKPIAPDINPTKNTPDNSQDETTPYLTPTKTTADSASGAAK